MLYEKAMCFLVLLRFFVAAATQGGLGGECQTVVRTIDLYSIMSRLYCWVFFWPRSHMFAQPDTDSGSNGGVLPRKSHPTAIVVAPQE